MAEERPNFQSSTPLTNISSCLLLSSKHGLQQQNQKSTYDLVKKVSLPLYSSTTLAVNMPLSRASSCRTYHKVTWQKSYSSESLNGKLNPYYSISGNSVPYEPQIDSASKLCCQILKLITFVFAFTVFIFFAQGLMYFVYTVIYNSVTTNNVTRTPSARQSIRNLFGPIDDIH